MKLLILINQMIKNYKEMFNVFPEKIVIGPGAKRQLEIEIFEFNMDYPKGPQKSLVEISKDLKNKNLRYMGVSIVLDDNEEFVRLESK